MRNWKAINNASWRGGAVGFTDEVVSFARDIAMHPETWLDFPLPENDDDDGNSRFALLNLVVIFLSLLI